MKITVLGAGTWGVALSGSTHAEEVARDLPTSIVSASEDMAAAKAIPPREVFSCGKHKMKKSQMLFLEHLGFLLFQFTCVKQISHGRRSYFTAVMQFHSPEG